MTDNRSTTLPYVNIDDIEERGNGVIVSGWMLLNDGPLDSILLRNDRADAWDTKKVNRPDLTEAIPAIPKAAEGGFIAEIPLRDFEHGDLYAFTIVGVRGDDPVARRRIEYVHPKERHPEPPGHLVAKVTGSELFRPYFVTGMYTCADFLHCVSRYKSPTEIGSYLVFECGCGWLNRHLVDRLPHAKGYGVDVDTEAIDWIRNKLPEGEFKACRPEPPIEFDDDAFDLIVAVCAFDHRPPAAQLAWLSELGRVLAPGGILATSTHGKHAAFLTQQKEILDALDEGGFYDGSAAHDRSENPHPLSHTSFFTPAFIRREWGEILTVLDTIEAGVNSLKDVYLLTKEAY